MDTDSSSDQETPRKDRLTSLEFLNIMSSGNLSLYSLDDVKLFIETSAKLFKHESEKKDTIIYFDKFFQINQVKKIINNYNNVNDIKNLLDNHLNDKPELLNKFIDAIDNKAILSKLINESKIFTAPRTEVNQAVFEKLTNKIKSISSCSIQ
jgi:hypothetical protein